MHEAQHARRRLDGRAPSVQVERPRAAQAERDGGGGDRPPGTAQGRAGVGGARWPLTWSGLGLGLGLGLGPGLGLGLGLGLG